MTDSSNLAHDCLRPFGVGAREAGKLYSLPALEAAGAGKISRLPFSLRIVLESLMRNLDGKVVSEEHLRGLAAWQARAPRTEEIPFIVARIIAPDASGIPFLADLAAMREAAQRLGRDARIVEPVVPVDLIVDHSITVERAGSADALLHNMQEEYRRNEERYLFLKWAADAFAGFTIVPPGIGIIHQVNTEQLARGVWHSKGIYYPDSLVGTDSHTPTVNGIGVLGWGVGGIEAEAGMLGQPIYLLTPDVIGVELSGALPAGVTATDLVLTVVQTLRRAKVVGKFVEFFGEGAAALPATDRCTIANMAPEYGATAAYFPVDESTMRYLESAGRTDTELAELRAYFEAQEMFGMPLAGDIDYTDVVRIDLATIVPSVAGPSRPQDRIDLAELKTRFHQMLAAPVEQGGFGKTADATGRAPRTLLPGAHTPTPSSGADAARPTGTTAPSAGAAPAPLLAREPLLSDGDIVLAAITSCANTSNPGVLLAAGLLARNAVERGLKVSPRIKTSFTPGSRVVNAYMTESGLQAYLDRLGFQIVGYGCATCMGNSGPLDPTIEETIVRDRLVVASVLSGNRNFEARIHPAIRSNFLMSPPLVVAFAIAGRIDFDPASEPLGNDDAGTPVYLRDIWPSAADIESVSAFARDPENFRRLYADFTDGDELWQALSPPAGDVFEWNPDSTYLLRPPFLDDFQEAPPPARALRDARPLAILGDSVTTDHVSPGSTIKIDSQAGQWLHERGVVRGDFNSYIARRTNHEIMMRGTFGNVRVRNLMVPGTEGSLTVHQPDGEQLSIYDAAMAYQREGTPLVVIAGEEYGTGSSRDWAAKGPKLLGVHAVIATGFERIHRSNLIGMGILPCQFVNGEDAKALALDGTERYSLPDLADGVSFRQTLRLVIDRADGSTHETEVLCRIDTPVEADYYRHGGILPYMLRRLLDAKEAVPA